MNARDIIGSIQEMEFENAKLKEEISQLKDRHLDANRFYASTMTVETVATLHNVHPDTVRKYVKFGLIEKHPDSMDAKILIRASVALLLDFSDLRKKYRYRNH